ncbi:unnamed protein product [Closterium sp. NIES-54]
MTLTDEVEEERAGRVRRWRRERAAEGGENRKRKRNNLRGGGDIGVRTGGGGGRRRGGSGKGKAGGEGDNGREPGRPERPGLAKAGRGRRERDGGVPRNALSVSRSAQTDAVVRRPTVQPGWWWRSRSIERSRLVPVVCGRGPWDVGAHPRARIGFGSAPETDPWTADASGCNLLPSLLPHFTGLSPSPLLPPPSPPPVTPAEAVVFNRTQAALDFETLPLLQNYLSDSSTMAIDELTAVVIVKMFPDDPSGLLGRAAYVFIDPTFDSRNPYQFYLFEANYYLPTAGSGRRRLLASIPKTTTPPAGSQKGCCKKTPPPPTCKVGGVNYPACRNPVCKTPC